MINIDTRLLESVNEKELWLLLVIAKRFDDKMSSFPSNETLMDETGWSKEKLKEVKNSLISKKILVVSDRFDKNGKQTSNLYSVKSKYLSVWIKQEIKGVEKQYPTEINGGVKSEGSGDGKTTPEVLINEVLTIPLTPFTRGSDISDDSVNKVYYSYPSKCVVTQRSLGKCENNKTKIKKLMKNGKTEEELIKIINWYASECTKTKTYMKSFATFLNNLPDIEDKTVAKPISNWQRSPVPDMS